jgi:predicted lipoprotein with Yx(FWY)xxD motif
MPRVLKVARAKRGTRFTAALVIAGLAVVVVAGIAVAKSFTLKVGKNEKVTNISKPGAPTKTESIVVNSKGAALYWLSGDSATHKKCLDATCRTNWPPLKASSSTAKLTAAKGIKGKLAIAHRGGIFQVTLGGHPLYMFIADKTKGKANGDGVVAFGGTWHVIKVSTASSTQNSPPPMGQGGLPPGY